MPAPYQPLAVANRFIELARNDGLSHMKLQKLVYCAHGWWLAFHTDQFLLTERPEVWQHGPVFPSLYSRLAGFGGAPIHHQQTFGPFGPIARIDDGDVQAHSVIEFTWGRYGGKSAFELSDMTHRPGTPWYKMGERYGFKVPRHLEIPDDLVTTEFQRLAHEAGML